MHLPKYLLIIFLSTLIISCGSNSGKKKNNFLIKTNAEKGNISIDKPLNITLVNKKNLEIDSVVYKLDGNPISENTDLKTFKLGKHTIEANIFSGGESHAATSAITILNDKAPKLFKYKILNEYPHDITSYTQGLEFHNGVLYESTGQYKESKLRKVNYKTGEVLKNVDLADEYFGEGLTVLNDKVYQLTWQKGVGFVYNAETLEKEGSFKYNNSKQGWGLCHFNNTIYKSDGTEKIWTLNSETLAEEGFIQVCHNRGMISQINEMEWIDGKIYANRYQKNGVAIINPENGAVIGVVDFSPLKDLVTQHDKLDVLNGIAYNPETKTIFVTGKKWDKLFEIELIEN
ncbi:glutaminyl-peptide cyclotransferase [Seonamhaeicola marinus]|uniref:Glutaminyl-peptide cyclotransferase n=1 Tax=Seonamhaeicola marinus TaxID=1912246 RepID=A0A5D0I8I9_9FLAO|nr:glutaminyl-peptide cyclotransferase [Seonamhaeicola marinus]TYA78747.1 glutaminyl-peptide cyclotransferase [Seonamhaeicola marinus]